MSKAIIIYGSTTGNTEAASKAIESVLSSQGVEVTVVDACDTNVDQIGDYDLVVLGASTWGEGDIQDDFVSFYEEMSNAQFDGKEVAVFGCGDNDMFPHCFCKAVDLIEGKAKESGANIVTESLKIDGEVDEDAVKDWASKLNP